MSKNFAYNYIQKSLVDLLAAISCVAAFQTQTFFCICYAAAMYKEINKQNRHRKLMTTHVCKLKKDDLFKQFKNPRL